MVTYEPEVCRSASTHLTGYAADSNATGISPTRPSGGVFGFRSNRSTLLVRVNPGRPGVALRQLRAPGRGATAPGRLPTLPPGESPSHREGRARTHYEGFNSNIAVSF